MRSVESFIPVLPYVANSLLLTIMVLIIVDIQI